MKPYDINNKSGSIAACEFCVCIIPQPGRFQATIDMRRFTCTARGGDIDKRYIIDEPCTIEDSKSCSIWLNLQNE